MRSGFAGCVRARVCVCVHGRLLLAITSRILLQRRSILELRARSDNCLIARQPSPLKCKAFLAHPYQSIHASKQAHVYTIYICVQRESEWQKQQQTACSRRSTGLDYPACWRAACWASWKRRACFFLAARSSSWQLGRQVDRGVYSESNQ